MKYQETLAQRELVIEDLPKSQQKKIAELEKLVSKIEEIEADVDDESREEFEAIKSQANQADEEIQGFIEKFDVEKAREQRARLAEMRSRIKKPVESVPNAPKVESTPVQSTPTPAPVSVPEPVREAQISPDDFGNEEQEQEPIQSYPQEALEVEAEEEFEKQGERKPRKVNIPLVVMGVGALLLTWGAVNFFKERR